jgi:hypothetical protein
MAEIWYRGQSTTVAPSKPGGAIHDFGDGMYLTDSREVAEMYARTRVAEGGGQAEVLTINIERSELGRVLDLNNDPRWQQFLRHPQVPGRPDLTPENLIKMANENYGRFFEQFVRENKIRINEYDAVIGAEFVRGGSQLAILHKDGLPSPLAIKIRGRLRPVDRLSVAPEPLVTTVPGRNLVQQTRMQGIVGNKAAMALLGQLLGIAIQSLGDAAIRRRVQNELTTTHAKAIERILARGEGVLVIISMQEWIQPDDNDMRARNLLSVSVQGGSTQEAALQTWRSMARLLPGPAEGWRAFEQYAWIDPSH